MRLCSCHALDLAGVPATPPDTAGPLAAVLWGAAVPIGPVARRPAASGAAELLKFEGGNPVNVYVRRVGGGEWWEMEQTVAPECWSDGDRHLRAGEPHVPTLMGKSTRLAAMRTMLLWFSVPQADWHLPSGCKRLHTHKNADV